MTISPFIQRLLRHFPLARHLREFSWSNFRADFRAGLNVALLDFPQGMAYALIAGLPVQAGIYSSALGSITGPFFASSRFLMLGPTNATAVLLLSAMSTLPLTEAARLAAIPLLLLMIAGLFFVGALLNAGTIVRYISRTVIIGYVTAGGCLIIAHQLKHLLGVSVPPTPVFLTAIIETCRQIPLSDPLTVATGAVTLGIYFGLKRFAPTLPSVALTLIITTSIAQGFLFFTHASLETLSALPLGQWPLSKPTFSLELFQILFSPALAIAFLALIESASIAKSLAAKSGDTVDIRQQMVSMGVANTVNAFGSGMPVSGSLTRSHLNWASGARSPISSIVSGCLLVAGVLTLGPAIGFIPRAVLAALVLSVGMALIDFASIRTIIRTTRADAATFGLTLTSGLLLPLHIAIFIGVGASLLFFLHKVSQPRIVEHAINEQGELVEHRHNPSRKIPSVSIVHVEGDLFFGATDVFLEQMRLLVRQGNLKAVILRLRNAQHLDASSALAIGELNDFARERDCSVILTDVQPEADRLLRRSGLHDRFDPRNIFPYDPSNATLAMKHALQRVQVLTHSTSPEFFLFARPKSPDDD